MIPITEVDANSAYIVANDSLDVLLQHRKRQRAMMEAADPSGVAAESVAICDFGARTLSDGGPRGNAGDGGC